MFVVIYKWQLKLGKESEAIYATRGSLGTQFMKGQDSTYYGVARWPDGLKINSQEFAQQLPFRTHIEAI